VDRLHVAQEDLEVAVGAGPDQAVSRGIVDLEEGPVERPPRDDEDGDGHAAGRIRHGETLPIDKRNKERDLTGNSSIPPLDCQRERC
jgi:Tfp pilus assembly protein PilZ